MKVISGIYTPDSGQILLDGAQIHVTSPLDAERKGISIVHQELSVFNTSYYNKFGQESRAASPAFFPSHA